MENRSYSRYHTSQCHHSGLSHASNEISDLPQSFQSSQFSSSTDTGSFNGYSSLHRAHSSEFYPEMHTVIPKVGQQQKSYGRHHSQLLQRSNVSNQNLTRSHSELLRSAPDLASFNDSRILGLDAQHYLPEYQYGMGLQSKPKKKTTGPVHNAKYKAKMCNNWLEKGTCPYFEKCQFAHGEHEIQKWAARRAHIRGGPNIGLRAHSSFNSLPQNLETIPEAYSSQPYENRNAQKGVKDELYSLLKDLQFRKGGRVDYSDLSQVMQVLNAENPQHREAARPLLRSESDGRMFGVRQPLNERPGFNSAMDMNFESNVSSNLHLNLNGIQDAQSSRYSMSTGKSSMNTLDLLGFESADDGFKVESGFDSGRESFDHTLSRKEHYAQTMAPKGLLTEKQALFEANNRFSPCFNGSQGSSVSGLSVEAKDEAGTSLGFDQLKENVNHLNRNQFLSKQIETTKIDIGNTKNGNAEADLSAAFRNFRV